MSTFYLDQQFEEYCRDNDLIKIMQMEIDHNHAMLLACTNGHLEIAEELLNQWPHIDLKFNNNKIFKNICIRGQLSICQWLVTVTTIDVHMENEYAFHKCFLNNHLEFCKWLYITYDNFSLNYNLLITCNNQGMLTTKSRYVCDFICLNSEGLFLHACNIKNNELIDTICNAFPFMFSYKDIDEGFEPIIYSNHPIIPNYDKAFISACEECNMNLIKFYCDNYDKYSFEIIDDKIIPCIE